MTKWLLVDIDCTLADTKELINAAGLEPIPGTKEHEMWVAKATTPAKLINAPAVATVKSLISACAFTHRIVFITNRRESMREITETWLRANDLYSVVLMRPERCLLSSGKFKSGVINQFVSKLDEVIVIDDDVDKSLEKECIIHGWTHLKVVNY